MNKGFTAISILLILTTFIGSLTAVLGGKNKSVAPYQAKVSASPTSQAAKVPVSSTQKQILITQIPTTAPSVTYLNIIYNGPDNLYINDGVNLKAVATYSNGKQETVAADWSVEGNKLSLTKYSPTEVGITAENAGITNVTARFGGKTAARSLTVVSPDNTEILYWGSNAPFAYTVNGNGTYYLKTTYKDSYSYPIASWNSDSDCATFQSVDNFKVKVTFVKAGNCKIYASFGSISANKTIQVVAEGQSPHLP